jgi:L-fuconolactonase
MNLIPKIDAHQHFWQFDPVRDNWITEEMKVIQRDFLPADLQPVLEANGFDGCVTVQSDQSLAENEFQLKNAEANAFIKGVVGWVDLRDERVEERLDQYQAFSKLKGFRHVLQGETDRALMLQPEFKRGISLLEKYNYTYDILIFRDQLRYASELADVFPSQKFILDHIAKPGIKAGDIKEWETDIRELAMRPNVWCKVSGMVTEADWHNWQPAHFKPYLDVVTEAFGMQRLVYGSDWPVCLVAGSYKRMLGIVKEYYSAFSEEEQAAFFGGNAVSFYNL